MHVSGREINSSKPCRYEMDQCPRNHACTPCAVVALSCNFGTDTSGLLRLCVCMWGGGRSTVLCRATTLEFFTCLSLANATAMERGNFYVFLNTFIRLIVCYSVKCSRACIHVKMWRFPDGSGTAYIPYSGVADGLVEPKLINRCCVYLRSAWTRGGMRPLWLCFYQGISNTLKMGTEGVPEFSENLHILMQLSARERVIE